MAAVAAAFAEVGVVIVVAGLPCIELLGWVCAVCCVVGDSGLMHAGNMDLPFGGVGALII